MFSILTISIQPPGAAHVVYNPTPGVTFGGHFLTWETLPLTLRAQRLERLTGHAITNDEHPATDQIFISMLRSLSMHGTFASLRIFVQSLTHFSPRSIVVPGSSVLLLPDLEEKCGGKESLLSLILMHRLGRSRYGRPVRVDVSVPDPKANGGINTSEDPTPSDATRVVPMTLEYPTLSDATRVVSALEFKFGWSTGQFITKLGSPQYRGYNPELGPPSKLVDWVAKSGAMIEKEDPMFTKWANSTEFLYENVKLKAQAKGGIKADVASRSATPHGRAKPAPVPTRSQPTRKAASAKKSQTLAHTKDESSGEMNVD